METTIVHWGYIEFRVLGSGFWVTSVSQDLWAQCFGCSDVGYSHFSMLVQDHKTSRIMMPWVGCENLQKLRILKAQSPKPP